MGNLSNLYISQSYTSLVHLGTDGPISDQLPGQLVELQDGLGNSLGVSLNANGDVNIQGTVSASNIPAEITSLPQFNAYTASTNNRLNNIEITTASLNQSVSSLNTNSASVNVSITNLNASSASQQVSINNLNSATQSLQSQLATIGTQSGSWVTESETGSFARVNATNTFTVPQIFSSAITASTARISNLNYPTADNGAKSFIQTDGAGNLSLQYVDTIWEIVRAGENVAKGTPLYISGSQGANPIVYAADAANPAKMPVTYIAGQAYTAGTTYNAIVLGLIEGMDLTGYTAGQTVYVAEGGGWTSNLPSGSNSITQVLGVVTKGGSGGKGLVLNPGPAQLPGLQNGYVWVGDVNNQPKTVATSSLVPNINTGSFMTTGSVNVNVLTFTKADGSTFDLTVTASGSVVPGTISGSAQITALGFVSSSVTASSLITASFNNGTRDITFTKGDGTQFDLNIPAVSDGQTYTLTSSFNAYTASNDQRVSSLESFSSSALISISNLNASSASQQISINAINTFTSSANQRLTAIETVSGSWITESETASFARTNVDNNFTANQTFTNITAVSASFTYVQTLYETASVIYSSGSNQFGDELTDIQTLSGSVKVQGSLTVNGTPVQTSSVDISALNQFTESANVRLNNLESTTASLLIETQNLELFSASALISINALNGATASYVTETESGSFLITASFDNGTRNLTFTKGNNTTFEVNIPDVSGSTINTASFATTGSNSFNGSQIVTGSITTTQDITVSGVKFGFGNPAGISSIAIGNSSTLANNTDDNNIAIGYDALNQNTTGERNIAIGTEALKSITGNSSYNTAIGGYALSSATSSTNTFALGYGAMENAVDSNENIAIGVATLYRKKANSNRNTAIGSNALREHFDGDSNEGQNMAFGLDAMRYVTSGSANTVIGTAALRDPGRANENVFIGWISGINASGSILQNVVIGGRAGQKLANSSNTIIGHSAGSELVNGGTNIFIGQGAGSSIITGSQNTLIGTATGVNNWNNVIAISDGAGAIKTKFQSNIWEFTGSLDIENGLTASLQQGYVWVGDANGRTTTVSTSSFGSTINTGSFATTGSNTFIGGQQVVGPIQASDSNVGPQWVQNVVFQGVGSASVAYDQFVNGGNYDALHIQSNLGAGTDFQDLRSDTFALETWLNIPTNTGNNPAPQFKRGLVVTGSVNTLGNQTIIGTLYVSSSTQNDVVVNGQVFISSSATAATTAPQITVSGSAGQTLIRRNSISTRNTTDNAGIFPSTILTNDISTSDEIGLTVDTSVFGITGWSTGPAIYVNNTSGNTYPAVFGFQNKANYTDGRVAVLTPLSASAGFTASLQNGYAWVGNALGQNTQVATSSFGGDAFPYTGSAQITGSLVVTGSVSIKGNTTFTSVGNVTNNIILGANAFANATTANNSVAIGEGALNKTTSGANNFALGTNAMYENVTGYQNVALGVGALYSNVGGYKNIAIGNDAGINASGSQNTYIGAGAGQNITGSNNTIIGAYTGTAGSPLNDSIILADGAGNSRAQYTGSVWQFGAEVKLQKGSNKQFDYIASVTDTLTVNNSLVTTSSVILLTPQSLDGSGNYVGASVYNVSAGSFQIKLDNPAATISAGYMVLNPS